MNGMRKHQILGTVFCALVFLFLLLPLVIVISSAFGTATHVTFPPKGFTLRWFKEAADNREFLNSLWITGKLCVVSVIPSTVLGVMVSLFFWKGPPAAKFIFESLFNAPIVVPTVISAVAFLMYFSLFGWLNTFWKLALSYIIVEMPYVIRSVSASLSNLDASFEEASLVLGCRPLPTLFKVTLPCIRSGISVGAIFATLVAFDESVIVMFIRSADTITFPLRLYSYIAMSFTPLVSAFATVFIVISFILIYILDKKIGIGRMY